MTTRRKVVNLGGVVVVIVAATELLRLTVSTRTIHTCSLCRAERTDRSFLGISWQSFRDTTFTQWYRAHRPEHEHDWQRHSCTRGSTLFGRTTFFACSPGNMAADIPPALLQDFTEQADNATLAAYFEGIASDDPDIQTLAVQLVVDWMASQP